MAVEKIAEYLAIVGFKEDPNNSLDKLLKNARKQINGLKSSLAGIGSQTAANPLRKINQSLNQSAKSVARRYQDEFDRLVIAPKQRAVEARNEVQSRVDSGQLTQRQGAEMISALEPKFKTSVKALQNFVGRVGQQADKARERVAAIRKELDSVTNAAKSGSADMIKIKESLNDRLKSAEMEYTSLVKTQNVARTQAARMAANQVQAQWRNTYQRLRAQVNKTRNLYHSLVVPVAGGLALGQIGRVNRDLQSFRVGLESGLGAERAAEEVKFLRQEAARLGLDFRTIAPQFTKLTIAGELLGFSQEQNRESFLAVAEAATVMQLSTQDTEGVIRALVQMQSKGRISSEELNETRLAA